MFLIDILLMYLLQRPNQRFCGGQTFIEKVGTWSKFRIKLSDRHSLKGQRIEKGREHKPNSKRKIVKISLAFRTRPGKTNHLLSSRLNLAGKRLVLQASAHLCLGQGHDQAWQSWQKVGKVGRLQLPPLDQTLVCALANRGFRLRSQMSHLALSVRTGLGRIMRKIGAEVIEEHRGI